MPEPPDQTLSIGLSLALLALLVSCLTIWAWLIGQWRRRESILPRSKRLRPKHTGSDVLVIFFLYATLSVAAGVVAVELGPEPPSVCDVSKSGSGHQVEVMLTEAPSLGSILVCLAVAVVVAPIAEEFLFRLLLQGWLNDLGWRYRRQLPTLGRCARGVGPVILVALVFSMMHFRVTSRPLAPETMLYLLAGSALAGVATVVLGLLWLRLSHRVTLADLGVVRERFWADVKVGGLTFVAVAPLLYCLLEVLTSWMPDYVSSDPIVLFPFTLLLGLLFLRTGRLVPSIALHMALNATSMALFFLR